MIKVRLVPPGQDPIELPAIDSDEVLIGRDEKTCGLVVPKAFNFVSRRHLLVLRGIVVIDQSTTGTFINGEKISQPTLLRGRTVCLGGKLDLEIRDGEGTPLGIEQTIAMPVASPRDLGGLQEHDLVLLRRELESERSRAAALAGELSDARAGLKSAGNEGDARLGSLRTENEDLRRRLDSLKAELELIASTGAESVSARLAAQALEEALSRNRELEQRVQGLEERLRGSTARPSDPAREEELVKLREELLLARRAALPPSEFFAQINRENEELRQRLARFESGTANPALPASDLFFHLQSENAELKRRLESFEAAPRPAEVDPAATNTELLRLRVSLANAETELAKLRRENAGKQVQPAALSRSTVIASTSEGKGVLRIAGLVAERDIERVDPSEVRDAQDFLMLETLRFTREAERVITRISGQMVQLLDLRTILPDVGGNLRSLTRDIVSDPNDEGARQELAKYLTELKRWLAITVVAPREAAKQFALDLKQKLGESALTEGKPIRVLKVAGYREAELWKRVGEHLKELTTEWIDERLEKLSRQAAQALLGKEGAI